MANKYRPLESIPESTRTSSIKKGRECSSMIFPFFTFLMSFDEDFFTEWQRPLCCLPAMVVEQLSSPMVTEI